MLMISPYQIAIQLTPFMERDIYGDANTQNHDIKYIKIYQKGVLWAILCNVVSCAVQFV